jgi:uncharacterized RDD family membrane protein YckC
MELLDTIHAVETPEGIDINLPIAGPVARALAWVIDSLIKYAILFGALILLGSLGQTGIGLWLITLFLMEWFYPVLFEVLHKGSTPGKQVFAIKVINDDGTPVDTPASLIRNLLRAVDFLPVAYGFGLIAMLLNRNFQRLGDLAAGTMVIYQDRPTSKPKLPDGPVQQPLFPLTTHEQRLIIQFAERSAQLSPERQEELANMLFPLNNTLESTQALLANARWLLGEGSKEMDLKQ